MSLHDEFEAVKHAPHELLAWVKSLLVKLEGEPEVVAESAQAAPVADPATVVAPEATPAVEGQDHA